MRRRFEGPDGNRLLADVLQGQRLIDNAPLLASEFAHSGELIEFEPGGVVMAQGSGDNDVYFIIDGQVSIKVNGRMVATRGPRESIGEMALVDGSARRSATATAQTKVLTLKLTEAQFQGIATRHPSVWRTLAIVVAERLRERARFHRPPNDCPVLFIGSSVEGLPFAKGIQLGLKHSIVVAKLWTNGVFGAGGVAIDSLLDQVGQSDFAAFVFGPDDKVTSRGDSYDAPRDNVIFELGLFMGSMARNRCFIVKDHNVDVKIPSDLLGVTPISYAVKAGADPATTISPVCTELEDAITRVGIR